MEALGLDDDAVPDEFSDVEIGTTGSLKGDVAEMHDALARMARALNGTGPHELAFNQVNPWQTIRSAAAHMAGINQHLRVQGFVPPTVSYKSDPVGFIAENADFLGKISAYVVEGVVAVH